MAPKKTIKDLTKKGVSTKKASQVKGGSYVRPGTTRSGPPRARAL